MPTYIAFLRAINVGGHTVKMDHLRRLFDALDFFHVETFIASGNVIFDSPSADPAALEQKIAAHLRNSLGYEVATFLRSPAELKAIVDHRPFPGPAVSSAHALHIAFLDREPVAEATKRLLSLKNEINNFHVHGREVYWLCQTHTSESGFSGAALEKTLSMPATLRNSTTVKRIASKYS